MIIILVYNYQDTDASASVGKEGGEDYEEVQ